MLLLEYQNEYWKRDHEMFLDLLNEVQKRKNLRRLQHPSKGYLRDWVNLQTFDLCRKSDVTYTLITKVFWILHGVVEFPRCVVDGVPVTRNVVSLETGYSRKYYCGPENVSCSNLSCVQKNPLNIQHVHEHFEKKYGKGITNPYQAKEVKEHIKKQHLKNLGVENPFSSKNISKKIHERNKTNGSRERACKQLRISKRKKSYKFILEKLSHIVQPLFSEEYYIENKKAGFEFPWKCSRCGNEFKSAYKNGKPDKVCPKCKAQESKVSQKEINLAESVDSICSSLGYTSVHGSSLNSSLIYPYQIDIYIPELKIGIEFNGIYWHSTMQKDDTGYHLKKTQLCESKGIKLIHIWEDEWTTKKSETIIFLYAVITGRFDIIKEFQDNTEHLVVPRDKFNKCWEIPGYKLISETKECKIHRRYFKEVLEVYNCGSLIYKKI